MVLILPRIRDEHPDVVISNFNDFEIMGFVEGDHTLKSGIQQPAVKGGVPGAIDQFLDVHKGYFFDPGR
jgi:hypothetical protein